MMRSAGKQHIQLHMKKIEFMSSLLGAIDPDKVLARGYTITTRNGRSVSTSKDLKEGMTIQSIFYDGIVNSKVE